MSGKRKSVTRVTWHSAFFRYRMEISCYVLLLVLIGLCDAYVLVANGTTHDELHEFQWASDPDLSDANCAVAAAPPPPSNDTLKTGFRKKEFSEYFSTPPCF